MGTRARGQRSIAAAELEAECSAMEGAIIGGHLADENALAPHRPGGAENPRRDARAWLSYYRHLHRLHARAGSGSGAATGEPEMLITDALAAKPRSVILVEASARRGRPYSVAAHPKSPDTLDELQKIDELIAYLVSHYERLALSASADAIRLRQRVRRELLYQTRLAVYVALHPGPGLPFEPEAHRPRIPMKVKMLGALDMLQILDAHRRVNQYVALALTRLIRIDTPDNAHASADAATWGIYFGAMAKALRVQPERMMRDWTLGSILASSRAHAKAQADAMPARKS